jgi:2'-5' RNA ligase
VRLFFALNLPSELREVLHAHVAPLREVAARAVGWLPPAGLHLTLKFLGDVEEARVPAIVDALRTVAGRHAPARIVIGGVGAFPTMARPRVLWLGVDASPRLELLQHDIEATCGALGFEVEGRAFRPHVTLGRVRPGAEAGALRALAIAAQHCSPSADVVAATLDLMHSTLLPGGARHDALARLPFKEE